MSKGNDDVVFFFCCLVGMFLFMVMHMGSIYTSLDLVIFLLVIGCMIVTPLFYSFYYRRKING